MSEFLKDAFEMLAGRTTGPLTLRLILQPTVATILGIRAGLKDARVGRPAYFWSLAKVPGKRAQLLRDGWKDVRKVFLVAILLDCVYEIIVFRWIYPLQAILVAAGLALIPYILARGVANRIASSRRARKG